MTGFNNRNSKRPVHISPEIEAFMLGMWEAGRDTQEMAIALMLPEAAIATRLPKLLERRRQDAAWDAPKQEAM